MLWLRLRLKLRIRLIELEASLGGRFWITCIRLDVHKSSTWAAQLCCILFRNSRSIMLILLSEAEGECKEVCLLCAGHE